MVLPTTGTPAPYACVMEARGYTRFYMAALDLTGRRCLVVGAGPVGLEKIEGLLACDAAILVVARHAVEEVAELAASGAIELLLDSYEPRHLDGCFIVIAATSDTELNTAVHADAEARSMLVNVADVPALCNFILPAVMRSGPIAIAISTAGASPALAQRMRDEIAAHFGPEHGQLALMLNDIRGWAKSSLATYRDRKSFFESIVRGEPDPIELLRTGDEAAVRVLIENAQRVATMERS